MQGLQQPEPSHGRVDEARKIILYAICGGGGVALDLLLFSLLIHLRVPYQYANASGYLAGTLLSFALNRVITFNKRDKTGARLVSFLVVAALGYGASALLLWLLIENFGMTPILAKLATLFFVLAFQYSLNRFVTFRK